jgi:uncharacterized protein (TIGR03435 family)
MMAKSVSSLGPAVLDHLWQSTLFVAVVWGLTLALKRNAARVRYGLWLAASMKFLVPCSLLMGLGGLLPKSQMADAAMPLYPAMDLVGMPFVGMRIAKQQQVGWHEWGGLWLPVLLMAVWLCGLVTVVAIWFLRWRRVAEVLRRAEVVKSGREWEALWRADGDKKVRLVKTRSLMEPGVFGVLRPRLMWPVGLSERLQDDHIEAIVAHEMMHVRRMDNLTAMLHMVVTAVFWFHPVLWWMERRMVEERERACDEGVVAMGGRPGVYAEGLLKAVRFCVESPLACVAGISGADLNRRVKAIMTMRLDRLSALQKVMLAVVGVGIVGGPVVFGQIHAVETEVRLIAEISQPVMEHGNAAVAVPANAWRFEVVSIRQNTKGGLQFVGATADGFRMTNMSLLVPLLMAIVPTTEGVAYYRNDQTKGAPDWALKDRYDIEAKISDADLVDWKDPVKQKVMLAMMLQSMLAERCGLVVHRDKQETPVYALVVGKGGPKFKETDPGAPKPNGMAMMGAMVIPEDGGKTIRFYDAQVALLTPLMANYVGRPVVDRTGLKGRYDIRVPKPAMDGQPGSENDPSMNEIVDSLGLKLEPMKGEVETLVIDKMGRPSEN